MDWNNINRDRDTIGLGPIEYDQSKVPQLIRKHADNVRTKTYGQEIREAQARNAELAGLIASEAVDISNKTKSRQDKVESQFNAVQQEMTGKDVISAPEIIAARDGEVNLKARLDKEHQNVTAQLAHTVLSFQDENGSGINNYRIPNNFALDGVQRNKSTLNLSNEGLSTFDVNTDIYRLSNFSLWGKNRTGKGIDASGAEDKNTNATIDNVYFNSFDVCIDTRSAYLNAIKNSKFQNSNKGIRILNDSYSNLIDFNSFLTVDNPLDISGTTGVLATNTLRFMNNTVELFNVAVKNKSELYIDKTYFGDNNGSGFDRSGEVDKIIQSFSESSTYINDSWLGISSKDYSNHGAQANDRNFYGGVIDFQTTDSVKPTTVRIENSDIHIASQNEIGQKYSFLYNSRSKLDRVILDNVKMRQSVTNRVHNVVPYLLEKDYTPLYSRSPMQNYVINGTFTDDDITNYYLNSPHTTSSVETSIVPSVMNQYGGKVIRFDGTAWTDFVGTKFAYRVPKNMVGKVMVLEIYSPKAKLDGTQVGVKYGEGTDLTPNVEGRPSDLIYSLSPEKVIGSQTPYRNIFLVKPTKEYGTIRIGALYAQPQDVFLEISSITLSELKNYELLGQYVEHSHGEILKCPTNKRPEVPIINQQIYDTTIKKPIWWNGSVWVDVTGATA